MTKLPLLGAAALLASTVAIPVMAQDATNSPGRCDQYGNCQQMGPGAAQTRSTMRHHRRTAHRTYRMRREAMTGGQYQPMSGGQAMSQGYQGYYGPNGYYVPNGYYGPNGYYANGYYGPYGPNGYYRSGFWPADTAAGIVGGAVGTAGAIATGAVNTAGAIATAPFRTSNAYYCTPGTYFRGADGRRHLCR